MDPPNPEAALDDSDVEQFVANLDRFLVAGVKNEATTIYIFPGTTITYRVGSKLMRGPQPVMTPNHTMAAAFAMLPGVLLGHVTNQPKRAFLDQVQSLNFSYSVKGVSRFRVHLFRQRGSLALCVRIIPQEIPDLKRYNLPEEFYNGMKDLKGGLYVIHGKARSGKSSVAAAVIDYINRNHSRMILSLEPTVQFSHKNNFSMVTQREVGADMKSIAAGIDDAQKQDQDIIVVDEVNDADSFDKLMESVFKGITVFAVTPTPDTEKTVNYLLNFRAPARQLELIGDLMTHWKALISTSLVPTPEGRRAVDVRYIPANILNGALLSRRTELEQKTTSSSSNLKDIEGASSVDTSWFDTD